jgi:c-di-GMP-binding flagellar brake protein YcgR
MLKGNTAEVAGNRRRHKRFAVRKGALAFLGAVPAEITDISLGGMSVKYVPLKQDPSSTFTVDFFVSEQEFFLPNIPCRLVSDVKMPVEGPFRAVRIKRLGLEFGDLTAEQQASLQLFFQKNALAQA